MVSSPSAGSHRLLWEFWLTGDGIARDDVDADIAGPAHELVHDRAVQTSQTIATAWIFQ